VKEDFCFHIDGGAFGGMLMSRAEYCTEIEKRPISLSLAAMKNPSEIGAQRLTLP
jgi:hypothetical protein